MDGWTDGRMLTIPISTSTFVDRIKLFTIIEHELYFNAHLYEVEINRDNTMVHT